jgi:23S rRNA-/tRNA-specific pseudouridylate synthase
MENQREVSIDEHTKGVILFARRNELARQLRRREMVRYEWIILVHKVQKYSMDITSYKVTTHVSYCVTNGNTYVDDKKPGWWGDSNGYTFYEPTEEQKQMAFNILKERNLRFISPLNKLVPVK